MTSNDEMREGQEKSGDTVQEMEGPSGLEGEPSTQQVLATLIKCIEKMSSKPDTRIGQDLPEIDPPRQGPDRITICRPKEL